MTMEKRSRLERAIAGDIVDRIPVALWRHWPGDDQRAADFAQALVRFQQYFDWDFVVVQPSHNFSVVGYGLQDIWQGTLNGQRDIMRRVISRSLDWTELRPLTPERGDIGKQVECLRLLNQAFTPENIPFVQVIYSPLAQAERLAGRDLLLQHMRTQADRLRTGLNAITETTLRFIETLRHSGIAGILYITEQASYEILTEKEYKTFGLPYDSKILDSIPSAWWFNMIQVNGRAPMLHLFADANVQVLNWSDQEARPPLDRAPVEFRGALCGGLGENKHLHLATPAVIRNVGREAMSLMGRRHLILGCGTAIPITAPLSNLQAARDIVRISAG
ncbi:MAG: uroporphyrinogen decarboxylase family protein [Anaerolineae bacterium]|nr:uroporphyrinogen decarboxylase family protein [Anaerolineae bacterium]